MYTRLMVTFTFLVMLPNYAQCEHDLPSKPAGRSGGWELRRPRPVAESQQESTPRNPPVQVAAPAIVPQAPAETPVPDSSLVDHFERSFEAGYANDTDEEWKKRSEKLDSILSRIAADPKLSTLTERERLRNLLLKKYGGIIHTPYTFFLDRRVDALKMGATLGAIQAFNNAYGLMETAIKGTNYSAKGYEAIQRFLACKLNDSGFGPEHLNKLKTQAEGIKTQVDALNWMNKHVGR